MHDDIDAVEGALEAVAVAHVADEVAQRIAAEFGKLNAHLVLLQLVAAEDDQLFRPIRFEQGLDEFFAKGTGASGYKYGLIVPGHN